MKSFLKISHILQTAFCCSAFLIILTGNAQVQKQKTKNPVLLADQYFAAGEYYTAAHLYEQYLHPSKAQQSLSSDFPLNMKEKRTGYATMQNISRYDILYKQAESYRLANYWKEAANAYKECFDNNPTQYEDALYWYAVCQRSLGKYEMAKQSLVEYLNNDGKYLGQSKKELQTLDFIHRQSMRPDSILFSLEKLNAPNSSQQGVFAPVWISDDQFLISSTQTNTEQISGVNPHQSRLFYATLKEGNLGEMSPLSLSTNDPLINQGAATFSADGNHLYFTQWKIENGKTISQIYYSNKISHAWTEPVLLSSVNMTGYNSKQPFITKDGKFLYFSSDKPGGLGKFDIWFAPINTDGSIGEPVNAGPKINTSGDEQTPFYHLTTFTLVFSSNGHPGMGGYDLFAAKGHGAKWEKAENLGNPVNSSRDDVYFIAPENNSLLANAIFSSDRGEGCCLETYKVSKKPKNKELKGMVYDCETNTPLFGAEVFLKDISGKTWNTQTNTNGMYTFELGDVTHNELFLTINKEFYFENASAVKIETTDETDLLIDKMINNGLCLVKVPEEKPEEPEVLVIKAEDVVTVFFDFDKSLLKKETLVKLDSIYTILFENNQATIQISGYTDGIGTDKYNAKLSDRRARACADYLIKKGIKKDRVRFVSFGKCCPVEMEIINGRDNPDGRSKNRRALINIKKD